MINIFNRKELTTTFSMEKQSKVRSILSDNNIKYYIKTINRNSPSAFSDTRLRTGTFGQSMKLSYEYIIYVHKKDYDKAKAIISKELKQ